MKDYAGIMDHSFPSTNWMGIPDLLPYPATIGVPLPVQCWGQTSRNKHNPGTWHHYTDDYRFKALEKTPLQLISTGCAAVCEVNYSVYDDTPLAVAFWTIYKKRWLARLWQENGVAVFVDCNMPERVLSREEARYGVPARYSAFSTRGYERRIEALDREYEWARSFGHAMPTFLVVGGGRKTAEWCQRTPGAIHSGYTATKRPYSFPATVFSDKPIVRGLFDE